MPPKKSLESVYCGDTCQTDFTRNSEKDIDKFLYVLEKMTKWFDLNEFGVEDIVRSGIVKDYIKAKEHAHR